MVFAYKFTKDIKLKYDASNIKNNGKKTILYIFNGNYAFDTFSNIILNNKDYNHVIFIEHRLLEEGFINRNHPEILARDNVFFVDNSKDIIYIMPFVGLVISMLSMINIIHYNGGVIAAMARKLGVKYIELQHELFQEGVNTKAITNYKNCYDDRILFNDIGFPQFYKINKLKDEEVKNNHVLICTNFNNPYLLEEDKVNFYAIIDKLAKKYKNKIFIIKPHPAENMPLKERLMDYNNVIMPPLFIQLKELVKKAGIVISTVSTTLATAESYEKICLVYKSRAESDLVNNLKKAKSFYRFDEIIEHFENIENEKDIDSYKIETGLIKEFNPKKLEDLIDRNYKETELDVLDSNIIVNEYVSQMNIFVNNQVIGGLHHKADNIVNTLNIINAFIHKANCLIKRVSIFTFVKASVLFVYRDIFRIIKQIKKQRKKLKSLFKK